MRIGRLSSFQGDEGRNRFLTACIAMINTAHYAATVRQRELFHSPNEVIQEEQRHDYFPDNAYTLSILDWAPRQLDQTVGRPCGRLDAGCFGSNCILPLIYCTSNSGYR